MVCASIFTLNVSTAIGMDVSNRSTTGTTGNFIKFLVIQYYLVIHSLFSFRHYLYVMKHMSMLLPAPA